MLKKKIKNIQMNRKEKKQDKNFKEGIINTLKLLISDKNLMVVQVVPVLNDKYEEKVVTRYEKENPGLVVSSFAVKNKSGDVLFMVTKIYDKKAKYRFNFNINAPSAYFQPDEKTIRELYEMMSQENRIRYRQGYMIEDAKKQKELLDWLNKERQ